MAVFPLRVLLITCFLSMSLTLDNGLARLPTLGWISSERFMCNTDCYNYADDCISERLVKTTTDAMVTTGFQKAGYKYVILDDCWQAKSRDQRGRLQVDPGRFPNGMKFIADYVHSKGLKLGLYLSTENSTCNGYPGSPHDKMELDAQTLVDWGVDMVKVDSCGVQHTSVLNGGGQRIFAYRASTLIDYKGVTKTCNIFKESDSMKDSWEDLEKVIKYFGNKGSALQNYSRPGSWSYANPILIGDYGLSPDQQRIQVALWSMMASPLLVSADLREKRPEFANLLLNPRVLAVSQDPLRIMGKRVFVDGQVYLWMRPIQPKGSFALAIWYVNISGSAKKFSKKLQDIGMITAAAYHFYDIFTGDSIGVYKPWYTFDAEINPTGVLFINATALL